MLAHRYSRGSLCSLLCSGLVALGAGAQAQTIHTISGTAQFNIGYDLSIPLGGAPATTNAHVTTTNAGSTLRIPASAITHNVRIPKSGVVTGQPLDPSVWQVYTHVTLRFPRSGTSFVPSGRTGPSVVSFCAGQTVTVLAGLNPGCLTQAGAPVVTLPACFSPASCPGAGTMMVLPSGRLRYRRTGAALGGPAGGRFGGTYNRARNPGGYGFVAAFTGGPFHPSLAIGRAFGVVAQQAVSPLGIYPVLGGFSLGPPLPTLAPPNNTLWSFAGPWTAGTLTVSQRQAVAPATEVFVLHGSDSRTAGGNGNITLVSGAFSNRTISGNNGNRGVLSLTLPEPSATAGAAGALLMLLACHHVARRRFRV